MRESGIFATKLKLARRPGSENRTWRREAFRNKMRLLGLAVKDKAIVTLTLRNK